ncbi:hybrid sensor histidine kinase/response regulator transcription factor [Flavivirga rizhaonensis]|nr:two-component regulator propeller domain-containing protein [Flavivirga rizhaonensis]
MILSQFKKKYNYLIHDVSSTKITTFCVLFTFIVVCKQGFTQNFNYKIGALANQSNITQNVVSSVYVDSIGVMWFGKTDGLYKYNGYDYEIFVPTFDSETGLSNPWITDIKDFDSYLVVGTNNGLNFLDKKTQVFTYVFPSDYNSNYNNNITCINVDENKEILVGTGNKLLEISPKKGKEYAIREIYFEGFRRQNENIKIFQILNIPGGNLIRTSRGVFFLETSVQLAKKVFLKSKSNVELKNFNTLYLTRSKVLLIATDEEEYYISLNRNQLKQNNEYLAKPLSQLYPNLPKTKKTNVFLEDNNDNVWIGTEGKGLFVYNRKTYTWQNYSRKMNLVGVLKNDFIRVLYLDRSGMIIVGTDAGINTLNPQENGFQLINSINSNDKEEEILNVHSILQDHDKNLWIGTRGKGLFVISNNNKNQINIKRTGSVSFDHIRSITQDKKQQIWIGTQKGVFVIKELKDNLNNLGRQFNTLKPEVLPDDYIYAILEDSNENKWISTDSGLYIYTPDKQLLKINNLPAWKQLNNKTIYTLIQDSEQRIWFGTLNGILGYINPEDYINKGISLMNHLKTVNFNMITVVSKYKKFYENYSVFSIIETNNNGILVGTNLGLGKIDLKQNKLAPFFDTPISFNSRTIQSSYVYGLLYDNINNILWVSSNKGLFSYNFDNSEENNYTLKDGLQSLEFNGNAVYKGIDGNLFFGGANGVNIYNTSLELKKSEFQPNLVLTKLYVNGKPLSPNGSPKELESNISYAKKIVLGAKKNTIGLEFASLHLPYSSNNFYRCKLLGVDSDWIDLGHKRSVNYVNLPKGEYTFQLMGTNNDGVWNAQELNFGIEILPAWYETWWMKTLWYLSILLIISAFIWILLKNRDNINALKIKEIERKKLHEIYESKLVFFTNLSHEFRTPLSLILDPINSLIKQNRIYKSNKELFDIVKNNVDRLRRLIDQIMDFRKFEYGKLSLNFTESDIVSTLKNISASFTYYSKVKNIDFKIQFPEKGIFMFYDQDRIEKIVYNLLSNAFKATANGGKVKISMGELNEQSILSNYRRYKLICGEKNYKNLINHVYIKVVDNGIGINKVNLEDIFTRFYQDDGVDSGTGIGLYMVKQFTEMHYGSILIKSKKNRGTSFIIVLPKNNDLYKSAKEGDLETPNIETKKQQIPQITEQDLIVVNKSKDHTIVVVEDNDELRAYLKLILGNYYNVYTANNGQDGLGLIQEENPDLIISDIVMPEINGLELCKKIKENFETSHIPIILLTAKSFDNQIVEGIDSGADAYITKPFNKDILISKINNLIQGRVKLRLMFQNAQILEPSKITVTSIDEKLLYKLKQTVEDRIQDQNLTLEVLAEEINVSRAQLFRKIKALTGLTPNNFIKSIRIKYAAQLLENESFKIAEIAYLAGFKEASYFSRCFKEAYGCSPKEYKNSH